MDLIKTDRYGRPAGIVNGSKIDFEISVDSVNDF